VNIFVLNENPQLAAQQMCDKHIVKMPVETAQMLSTVHRMLDGHPYVDTGKSGRKIKRWRHTTDLSFSSGPLLYHATMMNHPCTIWARETLGNYRWLVDHGLALCKEYTRRYGRIHGSWRVIHYCDYNDPKNINPSEKTTEFPQAMPIHLKVSGDAVSAYRQYYIEEKARFATWKSPAEMPDWFFQGISSSGLTDVPMSV
jgi:hypothetical protein